MPGYSRLRLPAEYQAMTALNARGFAWEWLRRNAEFRDIWHAANVSARRASQSAEALVSRSARRVVQMSKHPLAGRWSHWGLTFRTRSKYVRNRRTTNRLASGG
ncbi:MULTISPECIES: transcriptional regulator domain-containing protein [unclassified Sphingobium]|uniref:transcriptional regulator domain-containing protein n=1 Tax=unclassified Sphingobium TaxID=2611147 RepID=UPI0035A673CA